MSLGHENATGKYFEYTRNIDVKSLILSAPFALLVGLFLQAILDHSQFLPALVFVGDSLFSITLPLAASVLLAAWLTASNADGFIAKAFEKSGATAIVAAAFMGAFSPFCSCGVIPLVAALLRSGVPLAPIMAFWLASPITDPEMMILTAATLGWEFASAKSALAVLIGLGGGLSLYALRNMAWIKTAILPSTFETKGAGCCDAPASSTCGPKQSTFKPMVWKESKTRQAFFAQFKETGWFLLKWLTLAFFLEFVMQHYLPLEGIGQFISDMGFFAVPAAVIAGIPAYLNGYAAIPLMSQFLDNGVPAGAVMGFMISGGVTSIPAMIAVKALVRLPLFLAYLSLAIVFSMLAGWGFGTLF